MPAALSATSPSSIQIQMESEFGWQTTVMTYASRRCMILHHQAKSQFQYLNRIQTTLFLSIARPFPFCIILNCSNPITEPDRKAFNISDPCSDALLFHIYLRHHIRSYYRKKINENSRIANIFFLIDFQNTNCSPNTVRRYPPPQAPNPRTYCT
jgi:hypothetical protein